MHREGRDGERESGSLRGTEIQFLRARKKVRRAARLINRLISKQVSALVSRTDGSPSRRIEIDRLEGRRRKRGTGRSITFVDVRRETRTAERVRAVASASSTEIMGMLTHRAIPDL